METTRPNKRIYLSRILMPIFALILVLGFLPNPGSAQAAAATTAKSATTAPAAAPALAMSLKNMSIFTEKGISTALLSITMQNNSKADINMNEYGLRVTQGSFSYTVKLTQKQTARIKPGIALDYTFTTQLPAKMADDKLKLVLFKWDTKAASLMQDVVSIPLPAGKAAVPSSQVTAMLSPWDSSLEDDAALQYTAVNSFVVQEDNSAYFYADLYASNVSSEAVSVPDYISYRLKDKNGKVYSATVTDGAGAAIYPGEKQRISLKSAVPSSMASVDEAALEIYTNQQSKVTVLGALTLKNTQKTLELNRSGVMTTQDGYNGLAASVTSAILSAQKDGTHFIANVQVQNSGNQVAAVPDLAARLQYGVNQHSTDIAAGADEDRPAFLAAGQTVTYSFHAVLPTGISKDQTNLVLLDNRASGTNVTVKVPVSVTNLNNSSDYPDVIYKAVDYKLGTTFTLDESKSYSDGLEASLVDFQLFENEDSGYPTAVAKFKYTNTGKTPISLPSFQSELITSDGVVYNGVKQTSSITKITPGTSVITSSSYLVPDDIEKQALTLNVYDDTTLSPEQISIGAFKVSLNATTTSTTYNKYSLYPFSLLVYDSSLTFASGGDASSTSGTLSLDLYVDRLENATVDANLNSMEVEVTDIFGHVILTKTEALTGSQKLTNGRKTYKTDPMTSDTLNYTKIVNIYEVVTTPTGSVRRLIQSMPF
ncbi:hypothetical protein [Gorillibacterium massiliense]|uniref:hypothetical protein n=1 Tax=Gorillibacterium massiliense TaxID=1280390 RepID=UPI0004BC2194|nr:hypothetical protein [Gorillibacterium massiliense]